MTSEQIATALMDALDRTILIEPLTARYSDFTEAAAYDVGAEILQRRRMRGEQPVGRKVGFTNRTIWAEYGVHAPIWAHVYDSTVTLLDHPLGSVDVSRLAQPRIEPEIVLHFRKAPAGAREEAEILDCVDWIAHGFEIVQSHFPDWRFKPADTVAAFGLHGALIVGPKKPVSEVPNLINALRTFEISLARNGEIQATGGGFNVLDSPLLAASHFLTLLDGQHAFQPVTAGELVTTGTLTAALPVVAGETWSTRLSGLGLPDLTLEIRS
ncbi:MAG: 2-keto-4-pentenoate hydratase [Chloroflexota bacterium]